MENRQNRREAAQNKRNTWTAIENERNRQEAEKNERNTLAAIENERNRLAADFNGLQLLKFVLPTIIMMVFQGFYTIVDTVFVSSFVSTDALAAINVVTPVINLAVGIGTMLGAGGNAVIARKMGAGNGQQAKEDFTLIILVSSAAGILFAVTGFYGMDGILHFLGAEGRIFRPAKEYLEVLFLFMPCYMLQTVFANLFVTAGRPGLGSALAIGSGVLNIFLDYLFIVLCSMGIRGAALGTGIGASLPAVVGVIFFSMAKNETLHFCRPLLRGAVIAESCLNGSSEMVGQLSGAASTLLFNLSMLKLAGEDGVAAITILNYSQFLFQTAFIGFSMGVAPVIAYNHGSRSRERQRRLLSLCIRLIAAASIGVFLAAFLGSRLIAEIFTGASGNVYLLAAEGMRIFSFGFLFSGFNLFASAMFTALSNGKVSAMLSFLRTFVLIAAAIVIMPHIWGITGLWLAVPAAEFLAFMVSMGSFREYFF